MLVQLYGECYFNSTQNTIVKKDKEGESRIFDCWFLDHLNVVLTEEDKHMLSKRIAMAYVAGAEDEQRRIARNVTSLIGLDSDVIFVE